MIARDARNDAPTQRSAWRFILLVGVTCRSGPSATGLVSGRLRHQYTLCASARTAGVRPLKRRRTVYNQDRKIFKAGFR